MIARTDQVFVINITNLIINSLFALVTRLKVSILRYSFSFCKLSVFEQIFNLEQCYFNEKIDQMNIVLRVSKS